MMERQSWTLIVRRVRINNYKIHLLTCSVHNFLKVCSSRTHSPSLGMFDLNTVFYQDSIERLLTKGQQIILKRGRAMLGTHSVHMQ